MPSCAHPVEEHSAIAEAKHRLARTATQSARARPLARRRRIAMDGAVAYAAVEHVAWEARIGWGESSDEGSEGEPERAYRASAPGNAYLDAGDWAGAVRWGGDGESDDERRGGAAA